MLHHFKKVILLSIIAIHLFNTSQSFADSGIKSEPFNAKNYALSSTTKAVVLISVNWSRRWGCSGYRNAQIKSIAFDKFPSEKATDDIAGDIILDDAPLIFTKPDFDNYAFIVEPGIYVLSSFDIKVAESLTNIGGFKTPRSILLKDGKALGGTFKAETGEVIYIGHFYLDCALKQPVIWRYYADGQDAFNDYLKKIKNEFPNLDTDHVVYRLFDTTEYGRPYLLQ
jgi:hypothetical protein